MGPSAVTTTIVIIIILISAWTLLRIYSRFAKARQSTDQTRPGPGSATSTPATWPSAPPAPTWPSTTPPTRTSTSLTLDMFLSLDRDLLCLSLDLDRLCLCLSLSRDLD